MQSLWWCLAVFFGFGMGVGVVGIFRPERVNMKNRGEAFSSLVMSTLVCLFSIWMLDPFDEAGAVQKNKELAAKSAETYAVYLIGKQRSVKVERRFGDTLFVNYSLDPVLSNTHARTSFLHQASELLPRLFEQFPDLKVIDLRGLATLVSLRGHESIHEVARLQFKRDNATSINWESVLLENLPKIADESWFHPAISIQ